MNTYETERLPQNCVILTLVDLRSLENGEDVIGVLEDKTSSRLMYDQYLSVSEWQCVELGCSLSFEVWDLWDLDAFTSKSRKTAAARR